MKLLMKKLNDNSYLILTAAAFMNPRIKNFIQEKISLLKDRRIAIITTASTDKENNKYSIIAKDIYLNMNTNSVVFVDIETEPNFDFSKTDVIHICGGNTFKLLHFARIAKLDLSINNLLSKGGVCIGVSAGSLVLGPSVKIASEVRPDINEINEKDYTGLGLTDFIIFPHYEESDEKEIVAFEGKNMCKIQRVKNNQALVIHSNKFEVIE